MTTTIDTPDNSSGANEELPAAVLDKLPGAITVHDLNGNPVYTNRKNLELLGFKREEFMKISLDELDLFDSEQRKSDRLNRINCDSEISCLIYRKRKDGSQIPFEVVSKKALWGGRHVLISIATDKSDQIRHENDIKESEERLRLTMLAINDAFWDWNVQTGNAIFSDNYYRMLGYEAGDFPACYDSWKERIHPDDAERVERTINSELEKKDGFSVEFRMLEKSGNWKWILGRGRLVEKDPHGNPLRMVGTHTDISERKRDEQRILESEEKFRQLSESSTAGIFIHSGDNLIYVNKATCTNTGFTLDELYSMKFIDIVHPDDRDMVLDIWNRRVKGEEVPSFYESRLITKDGGFLWAVISGTNIKYEGKPALIGTAFNITSKKKAEIALKESEERYKALHNASFGGIVIHDKGLILECNQGLSDITGYSYDELIGMNGLLLIAEHARDLVVKNINDGYEKPYESIGVRKNGEEYPIRLEARNIPFRGKTVRATEFRDISSSKLVEENLKKSENVLQRIFNVLPIGLWFADETGKLIRGNPAGVRIWGAEPRVDIEEYGVFKARRLPENVEIVPHEWALARSIRNGETVSGELLEIDAFDGQTKVILNYTTPIIDDDGKVLGAIVMNEDVTEKHLAEKEKDKLQRELAQAQKMESIGRLAGGIAHDFNNMLSVIIGRAEIALMKAEVDSEINDELEEILSAAERSSGLTKQLLAFARKQVISPRALNVNMVIDQILTLVKRLIGENIQLRWAPSDTVWDIMMDPSQLDQIFANLCVNSKDAMPRGGTLTISTGNVVVKPLSEAVPGMIPGEYVNVTFQDTGCGMDKEVADRIFEPFFTTKDIGKGTGLGLSTVFGIVKQNKGYIYCSSKIGAGTLFSMYFPRSGEKQTQQSEETSICMTKITTRLILLVEDEPAILKMTESMLRGFGYTVVSANSPQEALRVSTATSSEIDLLITDVIMPQMNGKELSEVILTNHPEMKCLFMSGYTDDVIANHGIINKNMNFIQKPFTMKALGKKVSSILGQQEDEKQQE